MSDFKKASDWWEGSDGKWYPPVAKKTEQAVASEPLPSVSAGKPKSKRRRVILLSIFGLMIVGAAILVYQIQRPEDVWTYMDLKLVDSKRDSSGWDILPDCENKGAYGSDTSACSCELSNGYRDLREGLSVVVLGDKGDEVGRGELGRGQFHHIGDTYLTLNMGQYDRTKGRECIWNIRDLSVPDNQEYYVVKIENRGEIKFDFEEISEFGNGPIIEDD